LIFQVGDGRQLTGLLMKGLSDELNTYLASAETAVAPQYDRGILGVE
jgi:hypothetical protein